MEHVVFFPGPDAAPAFRRFSALDEAVRFVEHLRNVEGVSEVSVHQLSPVPLAFRTYYRVEVSGPEPVAEAPAMTEPVAEPVAESSPEPQPEPAAVAEEPVAEQPEMPLEQAAVMETVGAPEPAPASNGKRSLGFFAH